jgi:hypothetical protein
MIFTHAAICYANGAAHMLTIAVLICSGSTCTGNLASTFTT